MKKIIELLIYSQRIYRISWTTGAALGSGAILITPALLVVAGCAFVFAFVVGCVRLVRRLWPKAKDDIPRASIKRRWWR